MFRGSLILVRSFALIILLVLAPVPAGPSTSPSNQTRTWLLQLGDREPDARDRAREQLMGLRRDDLSELRRIVADARPLNPDQAAALREIVTHIYLTGEPYAANEDGTGFIGVRLRMNFNSRELGAIVDSRVPGMAAYRMLRDGDTIVGLQETPLVVDGRQALQALIKQFRAGQIVHLKVQRGGKLLTIAVKLEPAPKNPDRFAEEWELQIAAADDYWNATFAPLLDPPTTQTTGL